MIPEKFIEEVQARIDIVEIISNYLHLKKTGKNFKACCPFHSEKTPSFIVSPHKQIFHCFGCGQGGGAFQFLMQMEKVDFPEAVEMLAKRAGLAMPSRGNRGRGQLKNSCFEAAKAALEFYHKALKSKDYRPVLDYLKKRGIAEKTINTFSLGFAPGRNSLIGHLRKKGFTLDILEKTSLVSSKGEGFRDIFCGRIMFPIFDIRGRVIGFGGRLWQPAGNSPKYINSGESLIYSKRKSLFGLNLAKSEIIKQGYAYLAEGYLDMVTPFMRGVKNIAASLGTSLTEEQIKLISRFCSRVVLIFDSDNAGQSAGLRTLDLLLENQIRAAVVDLPPGEDPDSIVRKKGRDYFLKLIKTPCDFFSYKLRVLKKQFGLESIEGRSRIAESMLFTLSKINNEVEKYQYLSRLAKELKLREEAIISEYKRRFAAGGGLRVGRQEPSLKDKGLLPAAFSITEQILLKAMLTDKKVFYLVKRNFIPDDFSYPLARKTVAFLFKRFSEGIEEKKDILSGIEDKEVSGFVSRLILEDDLPRDNESLKQSLLKLRNRRMQVEKERLKNAIEKADSEGNKDELKKLVARYSEVIGKAAGEIQ